MQVTIANFERAVAALPLEPPVPPVIVKTLKLLYSVLERDESWNGGCYMVTAVGHILLSEQGVASLPCIGEAANAQGPFDHGWLEIDSAIYDLPIQYPMEASMRMPAVIRGLHFGGTAPNLLYGTDPESYGKVAIGGDGARYAIQLLTLSQYLDGAEAHGVDLWAVIRVLGKALNLDLEREALRRKYSKTRWVLRDGVKIPESLMRGWTRLH